MNAPGKREKLEKSKETGKRRFLNLVDRFLEGKTTSEENRSLLNYYESFQESQEWLDELGSQDKLKEKMLVRLKSELESTDQHKIVKLSWTKEILKYASVAIILMGLVYLVGGKKEIVQEQPVSTTYEKEQKAITLTLDDGKVAVVEENGQKQILDVKGNVVGTQKGNFIDYHSEEVTEKLVYNELSVPYGKRFDLVLSDGTQVKLNSGSSIKYPVTFLKKGARKVFLDGEAYFEVAKDKNLPFVVSTDDIDVQVLGTAFNMSHYPEDEEINTVLVEGSVKVFKNNNINSEDDFTMLQPGHKAEWNRNKKRMLVEQVDVTLFTAWTKGRIIFKNMPFNTIRKKLERHYNVTIINHNRFLDEKTYNATFDIETIAEVMEAFKENYAIDYAITGDQIIIN